MVIKKPWNMKYEEPLFYMATNASLLLSSHLYINQPHRPADSSATYQKCEVSTMH